MPLLKIWKTRNWPQDCGKRFQFAMPKNGDFKKTSTTHLHSSHMPKYFSKASLQQYMNYEIPYGPSIWERQRTRVKFRIHLDHRKSNRNSRNILFCLFCKAFDSIGSAYKLWKTYRHDRSILPAFWNLMQVKKQRIRTQFGTADWFQIVKEYIKAAYWVQMKGWWPLFTRLNVLRWVPFLLPVPITPKL